MMGVPFRHLELKASVDSVYSVGLGYWTEWIGSLVSCLGQDVIPSRPQTARNYGALVEETWSDSKLKTELKNQTASHESK